jgi:hypothetical protein
MALGFHAFRFVPAGQPFPEEALVALSKIPGVRVHTRGRQSGQVTAPLNAAWLIERMLKGRELPYTLHAPQVPARPTWTEVERHLRQQGEIREWVYNWLTPYQRFGVAFSAAMPGCHFWWPGGAGKTAAMTLWAHYAPGPVIVVTKASVRGQLAREVERLSSTKAYVLRPPSSFTSAKKRDAYPTLAEYVHDRVISHQRIFVVLGWSSLPRHIDDLALIGPVSVAYDEIHMGKSYKRKKRVLQRDGSYKYTTLKNVVSSAAKLSKSAERRLGMSATPVADRLRDLWGQLDLVAPGAHGGSQLVWAKRYCDARPGDYGGWNTTGMSNIPELKNRLTFEVSKLSFRETHGDLPPKRRQSLYLSPAEQDRGRSFKAELKRVAANGDSALIEVRLAEAASRKRTAIAERALDTLQAQGKVVIFTGRHKECDSLEKAIRSAIKKAGINAAVFMGHGGNTTPDSREEMRREYMDAPGPAVLIGTSQSWGTGYNLHDTDLLIFAMLPWTGGELHQYEQRVSRRGQTRPVLILYVVCEETVDEHVAARLISKLPAMEKVVGDVETASAGEAIGGREDKEAIAASILACLAEFDADDMEDGD